MDRRNIILASGSPRRRAFLKALGLSFTVVTADIDERPRPGEKPLDLVARLAETKARTVAQALPDELRPALVIAADTVVALGDQLLGKPKDREDAVAMLQRLREREHQVHTGVSILSTSDDRLLSRVNSTQVLMRAYTDQEIHAYVRSGNPLDKAGAYAIQHRAFAPVLRLEGCAAGVMGLPLADLRDLLAQFGVAVTVPLAQVCSRLTGVPCCQEEAGSPAN